jgi:GTP-binding protein EngB required for normal cell division
VRSQLADLLERGELALASCRGVVGLDLLEPVSRTLEDVRTRLAYPDDVLIVALAGGTGSGKSSIFNAIAGDDLVDVGGVRPTTSRPAALVPDDAGESLDEYLDRLGVLQRHHTSSVEGLCLLDLPDYDSVERAHRHMVDELLPVVDVVVWVTDPEKYHDARLHHEYLRPSAKYRDQFIFVLNQVDRLRPRDVGEVLVDFQSTLAESGMDEAPVVVMSVAPHLPVGTGIDELIEAVETRRGRPIYRKLVTDLAAAAGDLAESVGTPVDYDRRAVTAVAESVEHLQAGRPGAASDGLIRFFDEIADQTGEDTSRRLTELAATIPRHMTRIADSGGDASKLIGEAVIRPARALLALRALAIASVTEFALAAGDLAHS